MLVHIKRHTVHACYTFNILSTQASWCCVTPAPLVVHDAHPHTHPFALEVCDCVWLVVFGVCVVYVLWKEYCVYVYACTYKHFLLHTYTYTHSEEQLQALRGTTLHKATRCVCMMCVYDVCVIFVCIYVSVHMYICVCVHTKT